MQLISQWQTQINCSINISNVGFLSDVSCFLKRRECQEHLPSNRSYSDIKISRWHIKSKILSLTWMDMVCGQNWVILGSGRSTSEKPQMVIAVISSYDCYFMTQIWTNTKTIWVKLFLSSEAPRDPFSPQGKSGNISTTV